MIRFGGFLFDPDTGELTRDGTTERLAPQTAQVLRLLVQRPGQVVTRSDFRHATWPDTTVEFDQGLNFCIRQLRIALGDDAANPTFIETLPRRGYRFRASVTRDAAVDLLAVPELTRSPSAVGAGIGHGRGLRRRTVALLAVVTLGGALTWGSVRLRTDRPILAVVPFDADSSVADLVTYRDGLAESLVERTTNQMLGAVAVVGPSMTSRFGSRTPIDTIRLGLGATYALSGVVRRRPESVEIFAQLVRAGDRAHLWVMRLEDSSIQDYSTVAAVVADSVSAILLHPEAKRVPRGFETTR